jgi:hypothetical protein
MFIEITLPTGGRVFLQQETIVAVTVGKTLKEESPIVTTTNGSTYVVTVENEKNNVARLIGMRS